MHCRQIGPPRYSKRYIAQAMKALQSTTPQFALLSPDFTFVVIRKTPYAYLNTVSSRVTKIYVHS
jgi:hypothetical protein